MAIRYLGFQATIWMSLLLLQLLLLADLQLPGIAYACKSRGSKSKLGPKKQLKESMGSGWDWIPSMPLLDGSDFKNAGKPLLQMCSNTYTFQYDVNPLKQEHLLAIQGWSLSLKVPPAAPPRKGAAGMRALVYEEHLDSSTGNPPRVVLAFRGWQTSSSSLDELADLCAGKLLFPHYVDFLSPPSHLCSALFTNSSLDYLSQAVEYTRHVLQFYSPSSVLLTGHSFGGGLAALVSTALRHDQYGCDSDNVGFLRSFFGGLFKSHQNTKKVSCSAIALPVVSFLGPGIHQGLHDRRWLGRHIITISHQWDFFSVRAQWKDHHGWLCLYEKEEPASCKACYSNKQRLSSQGISSQGMLKPNASMGDAPKSADVVPKDKRKKNDDDDCDCDDDDDDDDCDDDDDEDDCDCDDDDDDDDDDDCDDDDDDDCDCDDDDDDDCDDDDDDDDDCDCDDDDDDDDCDDDDDDDCDCDDDDDDDDDDCDDDDDDDCDCDDDDDDDDDDDCRYHDESCWDCLSDTHDPASLLAVMEERTGPACIFLGGQHRRASSKKVGCVHHHNHALSIGGARRHHRHNHASRVRGARGHHRHNHASRVRGARGHHRHNHALTRKIKK